MTTPRLDSRSRRRARRPRHTLPAVLLALLVAATAAPLSPVSAEPGSATVAPAPRASLLGEKRAIDDLPSVHWLHEQEHADEVFDFAPGGRVTIPFTPGPHDTWEVDGGRPRALPAGNATGHQMRDAAQGSVWALTAPGRADPLGAGYDQPSGEDATTADPASFSITADGVDGADGTDGVTTAAPIGPDGLRREVFGFLPYWELSDSSTVLDWRVLSTVAYFSVGCRANGDLHKRDADGSLSTGWAGWTSAKMTSIINAAHQHQARVVLTVSCFAWSSSNAQTQASLLGSSTARARLAQQIAAAVRDRGADGVNLDFEPIVAGYADEFTALVRKVRTELNNVAPGYQLTFDTMGSIGNQPIVDATAPGGADAVFIMGYDYRTAGTNYAGSIAPLTGPVYDLTDTVKAYTAKISPSKVILGIPWYGRAWSTSSDALHARTLDPAKYGGSAAPLYAHAVDLAMANGRRWDSVEQAPWTAYRRQTCTATYGCVTSWRQLYYDDAASLKRKFDLVNRQQLRGVGIWALGYDDTRPELRTALADKFLLDRTPPVVGVATLAQSQRDEAFKVSWKSWDDSTVTGYDVEVAVDGGGWTRWLTGTTATSALYFGRDATTYAFRVRAADVHGNLAPWSAPTAVGSAVIPETIAVGGFATVLTDGLRMRASASTDAAIMTTLSAGDALEVIGGPTTAGGYTWYQVSGPIKQWGPVDGMQVGGWIAASGNGAQNAGPRRPVYMTRVDAGITGLTLASGGQRVLTPGGSLDGLRVAWTNELAFDSLVLRVHRADGSIVGTVPLGATGAGHHAWEWDGRVAGTLVPPGIYALQLEGLRGPAAYHAPSATPVTDGQLARVGVIVAPKVPTAVQSFTVTPGSPTTSGALTYSLTFGGHVRGFSYGDLVRGGTATGCKVAAPAGGGTTWTIAVTGCSAGTVTLAVRSKSVSDEVANWGPSGNAVAPTVVIDRAGPVAAAPKVALKGSMSLGSTSTSVGLSAALTWSAKDPGGAGVRDYDVRRSVDGGPWRDFAVDTTATSMAVWLNPGHTYRFQVRGRDEAGNVGAWVASPSIPVVLRQNESPALALSGSWKLSLGSGYSGGSARYATAAGASVRYSFTGRSVAVVLTRGPERGAVRIYLDGTLVATVDCHASTTQPRSIVWARSWASAGSHNLRIVVVGTSGRPRVDLDAVALLR